VIKNILDRITAPNPFGVFEVVLWHQTVDVNELYQAMKLQHPHYLDNDRQYILPASGNRSVTFTAVLAETKRVFFGQMQRQIMYWEGAHLPTQQELSQLSHLDGICLPGEYPDQDIMQWYYDVYQEIAICLPITFCRGDIQVPFWEMTGREVNTDLLSRGRIV
jgi:rhodanese-related sulfurtransferase